MDGMEGLIDKGSVFQNLMIDFVENRVRTKVWTHHDLAEMDFIVKVTNH